MVTITKNKVIEWMLLSYMSELRFLKDKIEILEKKYDTNFLSFEKLVKNKKTEDFEMWDDYIEWKAFNNFYKKTNQIIEDVKVGDIKIA